MSHHSTLISVPVAVAIALATPVTAFEDLRAPGATVEKLAGDFSFTEGPTADAAGNVFLPTSPTTGS